MLVSRVFLRTATRDTILTDLCHPTESLIQSLIRIFDRNSIDREKYAIPYHPKSNLEDRETRSNFPFVVLKVET